MKWTLHSYWLPECTRYGSPSCPLGAFHVAATRRKVLLARINSLFEWACSIKMAAYLPCSFIYILLILTASWSRKVLQRNSSKYPPVLTLCRFNNVYYFIFCYWLKWLFISLPLELISLFSVIVSMDVFILEMPYLLVVALVYTRQIRHLQGVH